MRGLKGLKGIRVGDKRVEGGRGSSGEGGDEKVILPKAGGEGKKKRVE